MYQISPPKPVGKSVVPCKDETIIPVYLVLGAFASIPKIHFEQVKMGQSRKRTLIVRNPSDQVAWLKVVKKPSGAFHLSWNVDPQIEPNGQCVLEITWTPTEEGQCFQAFQLQSSLTGIKFSVHLLGVCSSPPPKRFRTRPLVSSQNIQTTSSQIKTPGPGTGSEKTVAITSGTREKSDHTLSEGMSNISSQLSSGFSTKSGDYTSVNQNLTTPPTTPHRDEVSASDILDAFTFPFTPDVHSKRSNPNIVDTAAGLRRETFLIETHSEINDFDTVNTTTTTTTLCAASECPANDEDEELELASLASEFEAFLSRIDEVITKHSP